jgi:succinate dehydrogenase / fumarate reductase flavoprotein subunit
MGGIPTDVNGRVLCGTDGSAYQGLYAAGECACVSVHGANRLGTNSLVDLVVFGRRAGLDIGGYARGSSLPKAPEDAAGPARLHIERVRRGRKDGARLRRDMEKTMMSNVGIFRNGKDMAAALEALRAMREAYRETGIRDSASRFNTELQQSFELGNLLDCALITAAAAMNRTESRGGHSREDYPERDDARWLAHSFARLAPDGVGLEYKPVDITKWRPKPRTY